MIQRKEAISYKNKGEHTKLHHKKLHILQLKQVKGLVYHKITI
jgi:hypothetical protein